MDEPVVEWLGEDPETGEAYWQHEVTCRDLREAGRVALAELNRCMGDGEVSKDEPITIRAAGGRYQIVMTLALADTRVADDEVY
jgi:hypothetical protein